MSPTKTIRIGVDARRIARKLAGDRDISMRALIELLLIQAASPEAQNIPASTEAIENAPNRTDGPTAAVPAVRKGAAGRHGPAALPTRR